MNDLSKKWLKYQDIIIFISLYRDIFISYYISILYVIIIFRLIRSSFLSKIKDIQL